MSVTSNGGFFGSNISRVGLSTHVSDSLISVLVTPCQCRTFPVSSTHFMDSSFLVCGGHSLCQILTSWIRLLSDTSRVGHSPCQVLTSWIRLFSDTSRVGHSPFQVLTSWIRLFSDTSCVGHSLCQIRPLPDKTNFLVNLYWDSKYSNSDSDTSVVGLRLVSCITGYRRQQALGRSSILTEKEIKQKEKGGKIKSRSFSNYT